MCTKADVIFTVSKEFIPDLQPYGKPLLYVPHGIPSDDFMASETPQKIKNLLPKDYILYVGTVDFRLDYQLIDTLLCTFPEMKFVFVGPNQRPDDSIFRKLFETSVPSNLLILPPVHFKDLKYYISHSLACLAPMNPKAHGNNISHHKIFQYLAWGKPVFSCVFSEYLQFGELLYMDDNHQGIVDKLDLFLKVGEDKSLKEKRIEKASEMKFENHLKSIEQFLNDHPKLK
jgi:glycosyltransferase involved in cell wall biosynthesis